MNNIVISILAGLGGMFGWGTSDFLANLASEKLGHDKTFFWSQVASTAVMVVVALIARATFSFTLPLIVAMIIAGVGYTFGYLLFYKGFEIGNVSIVSTVVNLQTLFVMTIAYFVFGQRVTLLQIPAIALLIIGICLVSVNVNELRHGKVSLLAGVKETLLSTICFGIFFWPLNQYVGQRADWLAMNVVIKAVAFATMFGLALLQHKSFVIPTHKQNSTTALHLGAIGVLEAIGILSVSGGVSVGNALIIMPISSALMIVTIVLAMIFLKERITRLQALGILATLSSIILIGAVG